MKIFNDLDCNPFGKPLAFIFESVGAVLINVGYEHSFDAGVSELVEVDLDIDLIGVSLRLGCRCLRVQFLSRAEDTNNNAQQEEITVAWASPWSAVPWHRFGIPQITHDLFIRNTCQESVPGRRPNAACLV